ncbi:MAG: hypothetical protein JOZ51_15435 [Chloroflexi bacterium]|nr:hypothetical protein [Chloroflexota bacterium]
MAMNHDEATRFKQQIAREHPKLTFDVREYQGDWTVIVINPRTNESFGIVNPSDWQERLAMMQGMVPPQTNR